MIVLLILVLIIIFCILSYLHQYNKQKRILHCLRNINGPPPKPFIGNALEISHNTIDALHDLTRIQDKYGPITKLIIGSKKILLLVSEAEFVEMILTSQKYLRKGTDYYSLRPWLKNGLVLSQGSYWQKRRRLITPTFRYKILEEFVSIFNTQGNIFVNKLAEIADKDVVVDLFPMITAFTLDSICLSAMGTSIDAQNNPDNKYVQAAKTICYVYTVKKFSMWMNINFLYKRSSYYIKQMEAIRTVHSFTESVIEQRRKELLNDTNETQEKEDDVGMKKPTAFLDLLLKSTVDGEPLTNDDILEEVETFMFAGHDTTAAAISFTLYAIAKNQQVQEKLYQEIQDVFAGRKCHLPVIQDLNKLKYMDCVIKESLRMYPPVAYISRELEEDMIYKGTTIPKGVNITIFIYYMHHSETNFKDPEKFYPERFLFQNMEVKNNFVYIPFSAGPRNCIGQKFAIYEMKAVLCKILQNFELHPADPQYEMVLSSEIIMKPANGLHLRLKKRLQK